MRHWSALVGALAAAGCSEPGPTGESGTAGAGTAPVASVQSELAPPMVLNTQMRTELEFPLCVREPSPGHAQIKIFQDGSIESKVKINNKGGESVRFGHIHHVNTGQPTGPVIWWLTAPVGTPLNVTERHLEFREAGRFVTNSHFPTEQAALAELRADPTAFYVNFHSAACGGGFTRGFLH